MSATYAYVPYDWSNGVRLDPLPLTDVTYALGLSRQTTASARLPLKSTTERNAQYLAGSSPRRHLIVIERDGRPVWAGPVWARDYDSASQVLSLAMTDLWGWWAAAVTAPQTDYSSGAGTDYYDVVRGQIGRMNNEIGGIIAVDPASADLGEKTEMIVNWYEARRATDIIGELADRDDGFDWRFDYAWSGADLVPTFTMGAPLGRPAATTGLVLEVGRNVNLLGWSEQAGEAADTVVVTGVGTGSEVRVGSASKSAYTSTGHLQISRWASGKRLTTHARCTALAKSLIAQRNQAGVAYPSVEIQGDTEPKIGEWVPGDEATLIIRPGVDPRFPDGHQSAWRMVGATVSVGNEGQERVAIDLAEVNAL